MNGVRYTLERFENGQVKAQLLAQRASVGADDTVVGEVVRLETFRENGAPELVITTDKCEFNKARKSGRSKSPVRVEREGATITGVGFDWDGESGVISILSNVRVVFVRQRDTVGKGVGNAAGGAANHEVR